MTTCAAGSGFQKTALIDSIAEETLFRYVLRWAVLAHMVVLCLAFWVREMTWDSKPYTNRWWGRKARGIGNGFSCPKDE